MISAQVVAVRRVEQVLSGGVQESRDGRPLRLGNGRGHERIGDLRVLGSNQVIIVASHSLAPVQGEVCAGIERKRRVASMAYGYSRVFGEVVALVDGDRPPCHRRDTRN